MQHLQWLIRCNVKQYFVFYKTRKVIVSCHQKHPIKFYTTESKTHYDNLQIKHNASAEEIRAAFIKLSKQFHPDLNPMETDKKKFIEVYEAYSVLSKTESRKLYDAELRYSRVTGFKHYPEHYMGWRDETLYNMRDKSQDKYYYGKPYYGIKGLKKVSNSIILLGCFTLIVIGMLGHFMAYKFNQKRIMKKMDDINQISNSYYALSKEQANKNTKEKQIESLRNKYSKIDKDA